MTESSAPPAAACIRPATSRRPLGTATTIQSYGVCLAMFLEGVSSSSINVQVAAIRGDLSLSPAVLQLVATGFLIAYAGLLLPAGRLVDRYDRSRIFLAGLGLFAVGSLLGALAPNAPVLVVARVVQGAGAAVSAPAALALVTQGLPEGKRRDRMVARYGAMGAVGFSTGLVAPGFLVAEFGWRSSFLALLPCVLVVAAMAWRVPGAVDDRSSQAVDRAGAPDWWSAAALFVVVGGGTFLAGSSSLLSPPAVTMVAAVVLGALGVVIARRRTVLPPRVVSQRRVRVAALALGLGFAGVVSSTYVLTLALQDWYRYDAFLTGLLILPQPACFALLARFGARWTGAGRWQPPLLTGLAVAAFAITGLGVATAPPGDGFRLDRTVMVPLVLATMALVGAGLALLFPAASIAAINAVPERMRGSTSAVLTTGQNLGGTAGIALITALALVPSAGQPDSLVVPMLVSAGLMAAGILTVAACGGRQGGR